MTMAHAFLPLACILLIFPQILFVQVEAARNLFSSPQESVLLRDEPSLMMAQIEKKVLRLSVLREGLRKRFPEKFNELSHEFDRVEGLPENVATASVSVGVTRTENGFRSGVEGFIVKDGAEGGACVSASYNKLMPVLGWSFLSVTTNVSCPDIDQAYAAGFVEGVLTAEGITQHFLNTLGTFNVTSHLRSFLVANDKFMVQQLNKLHAEPSQAAYWWQVRLVQEQMEGLIAGYRLVMGEKSLVTAMDFVLLQVSGDLFDLNIALAAAAGDGKGKPFREPTPRDGCSAIVKLLPNNADLFTGHNTWTNLESMHRIYKYYDFSMHVQEGSKELIPGRKMTFSSYPGCIESGDDYYTLGSGLVTMETTIDNDNMELYRKYINPSTTLMEWLRNLIANRLANSGKEWVEVFARLNSGTYNNQWMIVDYKLFTPGSPLPDNTFWILEQLPGSVATRDVTDVLRKQSYWPSYNIPYFPSVFNLSGQPANVAKYGDWFSYENAPRARIFARDHSKVTDMESLKALLRYNDFQSDPLSACRCSPPYTAENAIAARGDLNPANGTYFLPFLGLRDHAATDAKFTSYELMQSLASVIISGPTWDSQPPFQWSTSPFSNAPHMGQPDLFLFPWVEVAWSNAQSSTVMAD